MRADGETGDRLTSFHRATSSTDAPRVTRRSQASSQHSDALSSQRCDLDRTHIQTPQALTSRPTEKDRPFPPGAHGAAAPSAQTRSASPCHAEKPFLSGAFPAAASPDFSPRSLALQPQVCGAGPSRRATSSTQTAPQPRPFPRKKHIASSRSAPTCSVPAACSRLSKRLALGQNCNPCTARVGQLQHRHAALTRCPVPIAPTSDHAARVHDLSAPWSAPTARLAPWSWWRQRPRSSLTLHGRCPAVPRRRFPAPRPPPGGPHPKPPKTLTPS